MPELLLLVLRTFVAAIRSRRDLAVENLILRHQLQVALRTNPHPRLRASDRVLWVWLRRLWPEGWRPNPGREDGAPAWQVGGVTFYPPLDDWFISGTQVIHPTSLTGICEKFLGVSPTPTFSNFDAVLPVVVGHANLRGVFGTTELQITETPLAL